MRFSAKNYGFVFLIGIVLAAWAAFFYFVPPETVISRIGVHNSYLASFLIALLGGFSSITGASFYAAVITFAKGGADPLLLGLAGGLGLFASDSLFYWAASKGKDLVGQRWRKLFQRLEQWVSRVSSPLAYLGIFAYTAFAPMPNDVLLAVLAASSFSYRKFAWALLAGDLSMALLLSHLGR
ncbi:MAG TPA: hypothetical protein VEB60_01255 [Candidatus Paceibacterota bacterium]|nr:hypothetical protein [Candidatus Paceibacterota bacterium]